MMENRIEALEISLKGWLLDTSESLLKSKQIRSITKELEKLRNEIIS